LIKCGAFDSMGHSRAALLGVHEKAVELAQKGSKGADDSQFCMFDAAELAPPRPEIPTIEDDHRGTLEWEKETLGLYVSDHPLRPVLHKLKKHADTTASDLDGCRDGAVVWIGGLATSVRRNTTRKGDVMAMLQLDDTRGLAEVMAFPRVYAKCASCIREDAILKVKGRVERKEGIPRVVALEIEELDLQPGLDPIYLDAEACIGLSRPAVEKALSVIARYPGESPLVLVDEDGLFEETICTVEECSDLYAELKQLLGSRCISAVRRFAEPEMERVS
jgi:DNA polymerase-3 subunit alpha